MGLRVGFKRPGCREGGARDVLEVASARSMSAVPQERGRGLDIETGSGSTDFDSEAFISWYEARSPEGMPVERAITRDDPGPVRFTRRSVGLGRESGPGVSTVERIGSLLAVPNNT